jgi:hypothetical protein
MEIDNPQNNFIPNQNNIPEEGNNVHNANNNQAQNIDAHTSFFERITSKDVLIISCDLFPSIIFVF